MRRFESVIVAEGGVARDWYGWRVAPEVQFRDGCEPIQPIHWSPSRHLDPLMGACLEIPEWRWSSPDCVCQVTEPARVRGGRGENGAVAIGRRIKAALAAASVATEG